MSAVETGRQSAAETGQMSSVARSDICLVTTHNVDVNTGALPVHLCPVLHLSLFLDTAGIWIFIAGKNRCDYNLNLLN